MTACPVGYLEDLSKYFTENQHTINEDGNIEFTDFLLSESLTKLHEVPCFVYFHCFINHDMDILDIKFKEYLQTEKGNVVYLNKNEINTVMTFIKDTQKNISSIAKRGIFIVLISFYGITPILINDMSSLVSISREDDKNICFKTFEYIKQ